MDAVFRSVPFELERADKSGDGLTLSGYAAVFDTPTRIDSVREGRFDEQIARGAFADSLRARTPKLQFDHGQHPMVGSMPLGVIKRMHEDDRGLFVEARLHDNWLIQPVRDAIASGAIDGMSFRFSVDAEDWDRSGEVQQRTIRQATVYEVGPVVFPAYSATTVGVRSSDLSTIFALPEDQRLALARALVLGDDLAVGQDDTASPDATPADEAVGPLGFNPSQRARALALLAI
jgi:HK97 family phage prohead protease